MTKIEFADILKLLQQKIAVIDFVPGDDSTNKLWQKRVAEGAPALTDNEFPIKAAVQLVIAVVISREKKVLPIDQVEQFIWRYLGQQSIHADWQQAGIAAENGDMYIHLSCRIALERIAKLVMDVISLEGWDKNECPVCGDSPAFACLDKSDGKRLLVCGACLTQWRYKRIGCAFCKEDNPEKLKNVTADEFLGWSVAVCQTCNGYLKTADLRILAAVPNWYSAVMETLPLDYALTLHGKMT